MLGRTLCSFVLAVVLTTSGVRAAEPAATPTPAPVTVAGRLDRSFGTGGTATEPSRMGIELEALAIQPDGKIVVAGNIPTTDTIVVLRYEATGVLDATFGTAGIVATKPPNGGAATALALTSDGAIVVVGYAYGASGDTHGSNLLVLRYTADGELDAGFAGGLVTTDIGVNGGAMAVLAQGDMRVVVAGDSNEGNIVEPRGVAVLIGYRPDGTLDPTFGEDGVTRTEATALEGLIAGDIVAEADGYLVFATTTYSDIVGRQYLDLTRFDRDGHPVEPFDRAAGYATGLAVRSDGQLVVSGGVFDDEFMSHAALMRWGSNGRFDERLGTVRATELGIASPAIALDAKDRVILASDLLSRRLADGTLDRTFGNEGVAPALVRASYHAVRVQADGKILAAGGDCAGETCAFTLARYEDRTQLCGDVDANGTYSVTDGVATLRAAAGLSSACTLLACDVDGSGTIAVTDAVNVLRAAAALPATLHCGMP